MNESIRFAVGLPPPGLRRNRETVKHAWRSKLKSDYSEEVWCAGNEATGVQCYEAWKHGPMRQPWEKAHLRLVWKHAGVAPDEDNAEKWCDPLIRTLTTGGSKPLGIILSDVPECLTVELVTQKVRHRSEEGIEVEIVRVS